MMMRPRGVARSPPGNGTLMFCCNGRTTTLAVMAAADLWVASNRFSACSGFTPTCFAKLRTKPRRKVPFGSAGKSFCSSARTCLTPIRSRDATSPKDKPAFSRAARNKSPTVPSGSQTAPGESAVVGSASRLTGCCCNGDELSGFMIGASFTLGWRRR